MSKLAITLADKIKHDIGLDCDPETFRRTYAGCNQKAGGAWTWAMKKSDTNEEIGSIWRASECIRKNSRLYLDKYGTELILEHL